MPDRVEAFQPSCAASVTPANAVEVPFAYDPGQVRRVTVTIPAGHSGLTGIALGFGHQPVLPASSGAFISGDDDRFSFDLTNYPAGPVWSCFVCNLDLQSHVWQVILELDELVIPQPIGPPLPIPAEQIIAAGA